MGPESGDVVVRDFDGNVLSSFWQYGLMDWDLFYSCLDAIISANDSWAIFHYDEHAPGRKGALCPPACKEYPTPGTYILLTPDASPISVGLVAAAARPRHPTTSNTQTGTNPYRDRVRARDPYCLISGLQVVEGDFSRFKATHIFPRAYEAEWVNNDYPSLITDSAPLEVVGGSSKIDSLQNVLLLRSDLHNAWDNHCIAVNPSRGHVVIPLLRGYDDVAGKVLKLDHILDAKLRPLDELFRDHFLQAVLKNMKGVGEPYWDHENALGDGWMDLSRHDIWGGESGKAHLEFEMAHRLHGLRVAQEHGR